MGEVGPSSKIQLKLRIRKQQKHSMQRQKSFRKISDYLIRVKHEQVVKFKYFIYAVKYLFFIRSLVLSSKHFASVKPFRINGLLECIG